MGLAMDEFTFGQCSVCGEHKALKNNVCAECTDKSTMPEFIVDLFKNKE